MKPRLHEPNEFNTPAEMLNRLAFVAMLIGFVGGTILVVAGMFLQQWQLLVAGAAAWLSAGIVRDWLQRSGNLPSAGESFDTLTHNDAATDESPAVQLARLLEQWASLEGKRGTAEFDPWALQAVRHDIHELVTRDPTLAALFEEHRQRQAA